MLYGSYSYLYFQCDIRISVLVVTTLSPVLMTGYVYLHAHARCAHSKGQSSYCIHVFVADDVLWSMF